MFNVEIGETIIKFQVEQNSEKSELVHCLRQPNAKEWKDYQLEKAGEVHIKSGSEGFTTKPGAAIAAARLSLYDKIATKTEGYCMADGTPVDCTKSGWRELIPPEHKIVAVAKWDPAERISFDGDEEKNL